MGLRYTKRNLNGLGSLDWVTIMIYAILVVLGAISIYAASYDYDQASIFDFAEFSGKQFVWIGLSLLLGGGLLLLDKSFYEGSAYIIYAMMIMLLIVTIVIAPDIKGSRSWLPLGPVNLQPAEFTKFATALALAKLFSSYSFSLNKSWRNYLLAFTIMLLPVMLIIMQRETGSALVYFSLVLVLYREGMSGLVLSSAVWAVTIFVITAKYSEQIMQMIPMGEFIIFILVSVIIPLALLFYCRDYKTWRRVAIANILLGAIYAAIVYWTEIDINAYIYFGVTITGSLVYAIVYAYFRALRKVYLLTAFVVTSVLFMFSVNYVFNSVLQPHQQKRIKVTLGIEEDLRGAGYNVNQSKIAIGSGGLWGKGFLNGTQTKLKYVPEQHTDFIFCTVGEEHGFVGSMTVLLLYLIFIIRLINMAERQTTTFARVYGYSVVSYLIFHLFINVGMVIGITPVIGIPLPFFSYGGSSLWGFTFLIFILLRLDASK
ncbi:MAG: rod shape-determining protein RodA [Bacteroidales bacterium]